ncbi:MULTISPECIES: hypothetical protein [Escherichia]|jgi:hypothetical protein|uniref:hypothetical protein n=1 Tax=Escherichia TaxID=561 RepID=UPI00032E7B4A|nr:MULTISPECIES: hypothetical protein [Escherichia]EOQ64140.1 hypothetical protein WEW_00747 [Escherichia coli KTE33]EOU79822.1 hypothetical protein WES_02199 [Escherichia sp. KTE31]
MTFPRNALLYCVRRDELKEILNHSEFPVEFKQTYLHQRGSEHTLPLNFDIDELHVTITPLISGKYGWDISPTDSLMIELYFEPECAFLSEDSLPYKGGVGYIKFKPTRTVIQRTVAFTGGITVDNFLYQLRMVAVCALHLKGESVSE